MSIPAEALAELRERLKNIEDGNFERVPRTVPWCELMPVRFDGESGYWHRQYPLCLRDDNLSPDRLEAYRRWAESELRRMREKADALAKGRVAG